MDICRWRATTAGLGRLLWRWRRPGTALALIIALGESAGQAALPAPVSLSYDLYIRGFPVLTLDFRIVETAGAYSVSGLIRTSGVADWLAGFAMRSESRGVIAAEVLHPSVHESSSHWRHNERGTHLDFAADGTVAAVVSGAEEPGVPLPTAQQTAGTLDPLTAILAIDHEIARAGSCDIRVPIFDGRRRYDLVLMDEGIERAVAPADAGAVRRCRIELVKIAGFSGREVARSDHGRAWVRAQGEGSPALPLRIEFDSKWGPITVRMAHLELAQ
jgi:hypothetical protein